MKTYRMTSSGGTVGAVSGKNRVWKPGQILTAPDGEFRHLPDGSCEEVRATPPPPEPETATAPEAPEKAVKPTAKKAVKPTAKKRRK